MIWVANTPDPDDPEYVNITIDGQVFNLNLDDLEWIRDMCIEPAINRLNGLIGRKGAA